MKLLVSGERILACASDDYSGPHPWIQAPADFAPEQMERVCVRGQALVPRVPDAVSRRQAHKALVLAGLLESIEQAIEAIEDPIERQWVRIDWQQAQQFERHDPTLIRLANALGLDPAQLDALFLQAAAL